MRVRIWVRVIFQRIINILLYFSFSSFFVVDVLVSGFHLSFKMLFRLLYNICITINFFHVWIYRNEFQLCVFVFVLIFRSSHILSINLLVNGVWKLRNSSTLRSSTESMENEFYAYLYCKSVCLSVVNFCVWGEKIEQICNQLRYLLYRDIVFICFCCCCCPCTLAACAQFSFG